VGCRPFYCDNRVTDGRYAKWERLVVTCWRASVNGGGMFLLFLNINERALGKGVVGSGYLGDNYKKYIH